MHVPVLPLSSVTDNVTVLAPRLAQVNELGETLIEAIVQLSVLPLLTCEAVMLAVPDALS